MIPQQVLPLRVRVDLGVMALKKYYTPPREPQNSNRTTGCSLVSYPEHSIEGCLTPLQGIETAYS